MRPTTIALGVVLLLSIVAGWFFTVHEKVEVERYVGFRGEARVNDFLAAEMLLQELGVDAESRPTLTPTEWLPDTADTVIVRLSPSITLGDERETVLNWIGMGGHIVFLPPRDVVDNVRTFLEGFGMELVRYEHTADEDDEPAKEPVADYRNNYAIDNSRSLNHIELLNGDAATDVVRNDGDILVARTEYDDGFVTLVANPYLFNNVNLDEEDNARLFADVVVGDIESGKVWLTYQTAFAPLWQLVWRAAPLLIVALALLFGLWVWHAMPAFGPKFKGEAVARRSIIEHITASGIFIWRKHGAGILTESSTQALVHEADAKHPGISRRSTEQQAEVIARITGMSAQKVIDALHGHPDPKHREFTNSMQKLQSIRKEL